MEAGTLIISGVKTGASGGRRLWNAYADHKEARDLLRASIARAVCAERRGDPEVKRLATDLEVAMRKIGAPRTGEPRLRRWAKAAGRKLLFRGGFQETPEPRIFGPSLDQHLDGWLREAAESGEFPGRLAAIECDGRALMPDELAHRLPKAFEHELFDEENSSNFRAKLALEVMTVDTARERMLHYRSLGQRAAITGASAVGPGSVAFAAADALGAGDPLAAAIGLVIGTLGAAAGSAFARSPEPLTAQQGAARGMALAWVAGLLGSMLGERCPVDSRKLRPKLYEVLGREARGQSSSLGGLLEASVEVEELRAAAAGAGDTALDRALGELGEALRREDSREALRRLDAVIVASDLSPPG